MNDKKFSIRDIAEIGIFVGLAIVLNLHVFSIKLAANGGSISFYMVPLFIIAIRHKWWKTLIATGVIFSLISCLMDGYGFQYFPFDYFVPYGSICLISLVRKKILEENVLSFLYLTIAIIVITTIRMLSATFSGMICLQLTFVESFIYNSVYVSITGAVNLGILLLLLKPLQLLNRKYS